jgi:hypothetical protein
MLVTVIVSGVFTGITLPAALVLRGCVEKKMQTLQAAPIYQNHQATTEIPDNAMPDIRDST